MRSKSVQRLKFVGVALLVGVGCSSIQTDPIGPLPQLPPEYVQVPHPDGLDRADLIAIFTDLKAPSPEQVMNCDADFILLRKRTNSKEEQQTGARELVKRDPLKYHWCFYGKLLALDDKLKNDVYLDEKQKDVLTTYVFLTPIARAFMQEFADTRYMRWAVNRYKRLSEYVFYRRLEMTPRSTEELASASSPFGAVRPNNESATSVLTKYGIIRPDDAVTAPVDGAEGPTGEPAAARADIPDPLDPAAPSVRPEGEGSPPSETLVTQGVPTEEATPDPLSREPAAIPPPVSADLHEASAAKISAGAPAEVESATSAVLNGDQVVQPE